MVLATNHGVKPLFLAFFCVSILFFYAKQTFAQNPPSNTEVFLADVTMVNGEFNLRDKAVIEKHASLQNFHFQLSLQTPEFVRANSLEICLKIGDILLVPNKKEDPVHFSTFKFPEQC